MARTSPVATTGRALAYVNSETNVGVPGFVTPCSIVPWLTLRPARTWTLLPLPKALRLFGRVIVMPVGAVEKFIVPIA